MNTYAESQRSKLARALEDAGRALQRACAFHDYLLDLEDSEDDERLVNAACSGIGISLDDLAAELMGAGDDIRRGLPSFDEVEAVGMDGTLREYGGVPVLWSDVEYAKVKGHPVKPRALKES